jgi:hypothetical protein
MYQATVNLQIAKFQADLDRAKIFLVWLFLERNFLIFLAGSPATSWCLCQ